MQITKIIQKIKRLFGLSPNEVPKWNPNGGRIIESYDNLLMTEEAMNPPYGHWCCGYDCQICKYVLHDEAQLCREFLDEQFKRVESIEDLKWPMKIVSKDDLLKEYPCKSLKPKNESKKN